MKPLRVAFVGCGGIGDHYLNVYRDLDFVEVVACIDANIERAERAAAMLDDKPRATSEFADALARGVDVVV
ncbi:MAG: Gfo/Idh/MocA family oxidoreductase, partial [Blastocatellia bacterium]